MPSQISAGQLNFDAIRCLNVSLAEKLDAVAQRIWKNQKTVALLEDRLVDRLVTGKAGSDALASGAQFPPFVLPDSEGGLVGSDELLKNGPLVVSFNRGHWCPFCRMELLAFAEIYPDVRNLGANLVSITPETGEFASKLKNDDDIAFPVLSDIDNGYALASGLMISFGDDLRDALFEYGVDLAVFHGNEGLFMPIPATYVVAQGGVVEHAYVNPDFRERMQPEQVISVLKSL